MATNGDSRVQIAVNSSEDFAKHLKRICDTDNFPHRMLKPRYGTLVGTPPGFFEIYIDNGRTGFPLGERPVGYIWHTLAHELIQREGWEVTPLKSDRTTGYVKLFGNNVVERTAIVSDTIEAWRQFGRLEILKMRDRMMRAVYNEWGDIVFRVEDRAAALLGIVNYRVHLNLHYRDPENNSHFRVWLRKFDQGGCCHSIASGDCLESESPRGALLRLVRDTTEMPLDFAKVANYCGLVSYCHFRPDQSFQTIQLVYPEVVYVFELEVHNTLIPLSKVDLEWARALPYSEITEELFMNHFDRNCELGLIMFFLWSSIWSPDNTMFYVEICSRLHRTLDIALRPI